jgi:pilus assembly protein Flp/PilA
MSGEAWTAVRHGEPLANRTGGATAAPAGGAEPRKEYRQMLDFIQMKALVFLAGLKTEREEGQALVEYALILSLIAVVAIGVLTVLGKNVSTILDKIATAI